MGKGLERIELHLMGFTNSNVCLVNLVELRVVDYLNEITLRLHLERTVVKPYQ